MLVNPFLDVMLPRMDKLPTISVNGQCYDAASAAFSVEDRSFRFGDGFFQTIAVHRGVPFQWEHHKSAMNDAANISRIALSDDVTKWLKSFLKQSGLREGLVRVTVSRGVGSRGYLPTSNKTMVLMEAMSGPAPTEMGQQKAFVSSVRRFAASMLPGHVKWNLGLPNSLALLEAQDGGCDTAIQLSHEGMVSEAANGNLFWEKDGELYTPALSTNCVAGSTRRALMRCYEGRIHEVSVPLREMLFADAIYITNSRVVIAQIMQVEPQEIAFEPYESPLFNLLAEDRAAYSAHHKESWA